MAFPVFPVEEMERFAQELFDRPEQAHKAAVVLTGASAGVPEGYGAVG